MNYYTSDLHLGHAKLVECGFRKAEDVSIIDKHIVEMINFRCKKDDKLYILGDLSMSTNYEDIKCWLSQLNPQLFVIQGNHDDRKILDKLKEDNVICNWFAFKTIEDKDCLIDGKPIVIALHHHPVIDYHSSRRANVCFHGHSHGMNRRTFPDLKDVGVDCNSFIPLTAAEVMGMDVWPKEVDDKIKKGWN
jgi:calcineurin-like phosphoesterase family protein